MLLKPFRDNITDFRRRVEEIYTTQTSQRGELRAELKRLMELNQHISTEAQNLTHEQTLNMIQWIGGIPFLVGALGGILTSVWSDSMIKRGRSALSARKVMLMAVVVVAPLCAAVPYVGASETLSFAWRVGLVVAIFSLVAVMCLSWLYTLPVVLAETFPIKNVASVMGICCGAGALGSVVFNQFVGSIPSEAWYTLFAIMGTLHIIAAVVLWKMVRPESPETK